MTTIHRRRRLLLVGAFAAFSSMVPLALVAPGVLASPFPQSVVEGVEAWLDRALPSDAPAGAELGVGATIWSTRDDGPVGGSSVFFRLYAADSGPEFAEVNAIEDWPGHFVATLVVPIGGVGELHIGTQGTACDPNGCSRSDAIYAIAGVGPPPAAPLPAIAGAVIEPPGTVTAGVPFTVIVHLDPRADWAPETFAFPDALRVIVREPRGPDLAITLAIPADFPDTYAATVTLPGEGSFSLQAAAGTGRSGPVDPADLFATSTVLVEARPDAASVEPDADPVGQGDEGADPVVPLLGALVIVALGLGGLWAVRRRPT